ncbi:chromate transporter [Acetitomaculum ruminis DSM 5522]|uniref:Chromate transporter n=1 Tax=Acetitomaculum ruminis DSM 5522 TaxID=1120918 RepID=A0A1I1A5L4_9FIRM|nr:chromate transporter [Acetitomaculum ruminis]SFB32812.1 chromate transporter [Acetitomaculum ruminis DSM 5522]
MITLLRIYFEFFKVGLFSIGGGLATIPFLYELSANTGWFSEEDIANMIAISESTPGALGINMSTYSGFLSSKALGGIVGTLGLISPSVIIIIIIAKLLTKFKDNEYVKSSFYGLRPASIAMISVAGISLAKITLVNLNEAFNAQNIFSFFNIPAIILLIFLFIIYKKFKLHPIALIIIAGLCGIAYGFLSCL